MRSRDGGKVREIAMGAVILAWSLFPAIGFFVVFFLALRKERRPTRTFVGVAAEHLTGSIDPIGARASAESPAKLLAFRKPSAGPSSRDASEPQEISSQPEAKSRMSR
jgi:hypothetical protein